MLIHNSIYSSHAGTKAVNAISDGLDNGQDGIVTIVNALGAGQLAPAAARDQVGDGLEAAAKALLSFNSCVVLIHTTLDLVDKELSPSTHAAVTANLNKLQAQLVSAGQAGNGVVENCK